jgi:uncharacterized caspase-like protein
MIQFSLSSLPRPRSSLALLACLLSSWACATSQPRVALVVGNGEYQHATPLANPANDAALMAERLENLGWVVTSAIDVSAATFEERTASFVQQLQEAEEAIFFYAGHGMQINGENYIVPIEFDPESAELNRDLISMNQTIERFKESDVQLAVFLDACRDNPLAGEYEKTFREGSRGLSLRRDETESSDLRFGRGLAELPATAGTFIAYSTAPGHVALDGTGEHSPFVSALANHIDLRNQDVSAVMQRVRNEVVRSTHGSQVPWDHSSLTQKFWINPKQLSAPPP